MSTRSFVRFAASALAAALFCVSAAPAAAMTHDAALGGVVTESTGYSKPLATAHADVAPSEPDARVSVAKTGAMTTASTSLSGTGGGTNLISFAKFASGDIVVVLDPTSPTGHAGMFDRRFYTDIRSYAVLSANTAPSNGVQREQGLKYRTYDRAFGLWVPSKLRYALAARDYAYRQMGKPYNIAASKTDTRSFYCSKLVWAAWRYTSGLDLDAGGGFWVWPVDLVNSRYTSLFGYWS